MFICHALSGLGFFSVNPRALPWADMSCPFRAPIVSIRVHPCESVVLSILICVNLRSSAVSFPTSVFIRGSSSPRIPLPICDNLRFQRFISFPEFQMPFFRIRHNALTFPVSIVLYPQKPNSKPIFGSCNHRRRPRRDFVLPRCTAGLRIGLVRLRGAGTRFFTAELSSRTKST